MGITRRKREKRHAWVDYFLLTLNSFVSFTSIYWIVKIFNIKLWPDGSFTTEIGKSTCSIWILQSACRESSYIEYSLWSPCGVNICLSSTERERGIWRPESHCNSEENFVSENIESLVYFFILFLLVFTKEEFLNSVNWLTRYSIYMGVLSLSVCTIKTIFK